MANGRFSLMKRTLPSANVKLAPPGETGRGNGTFYISVFFGRPRGRKLASRPSVAAVWEAQVADP